MSKKRTEKNPEKEQRLEQPEKNVEEEKVSGRWR